MIEHSRPRGTAKDGGGVVRGAPRRCVCPLAERGVRLRRNLGRGSQDGRAEVPRRTALLAFPYEGVTYVIFRRSNEEQLVKMANEIRATRYMPLCVFRATRGGRSKPTRGRVPRRRESERSDGRGQGLVSVSFSFILARALRIEPPRRLTTWALWTRRSQIASAIVASPIA